MQNDQDAAVSNSGSLARMKLPSEFAGQQLFIQGEDWHNNAMLGWTHFPWDIYAAGYKDAADALVGALAERKASLDSVVYPLVFLYRQGLELQLKLILPLARRLACKDAVADHQHGLMPLWSELRRHLEQLDPREEDKELPAIEDFISQLDTVDRFFCLQIPHDEEGRGVAARAAACQREAPLRNHGQRVHAAWRNLFLAGGDGTERPVLVK